MKSTQIIKTTKIRILLSVDLHIYYGFNKIDAMTKLMTAVSDWIGASSLRTELHNHKLTLIKYLMVQAITITELINGPCMSLIDSIDVR